MRSSELSNSVEKQFSVDHPTTTGHFPGNPIIPGAVLLNEVLRAIAMGLKKAETVCEIQCAKFLRPVRPGDRVLIRWDTMEGGEIKFACLMSDTQDVVLTGSLRLACKTR